MSLPEQGAKVATGIIDALKSQPALLLLVIFNALVLVIVFYGVRETRTSQAELIKTIVTANDKATSEITESLLKANARAIELLSHCVVPNMLDFPPAQPSPKEEPPPR